jgi:hypothetical protein
MRTNRNVRLVAALAALLLASCTEGPTEPRPSSVHGTVVLPAYSSAALIELRAEAPIDSLAAGFGNLTLIRASSPNPQVQRFLVVDSDRALPERLPVRVFSAEGAALEVIAVLLETADQDGTPATHDRSFRIR